MLTSRDSIRRLTRAWPLAFALLLVATVASAQEIQVDSATPDMAEQGTYDLEVVIGGDNFPSDAEVDFFITGTEDPGGITVLGKPKRQGPKTLKVKIDVAEDAQVQLKFDVRVRSKRGGRSGKGTELFRVTEKQHPTQDTTPPGMPLDLHVVDVQFGMATIAWTMPADDGYLSESGPVQECEFYDPVQETWGFFDCGGSYPWEGEWPAPGDEQECLLNYLQPDTDYEFRVRCVDEADNWSPEAAVLASTLPFSAFQDPSWVIEEVPVQIDGILGHGFDADGNVVIGGLVGLWEELEGRRWEVLPTVIRVITGVHDETFDTWTWTYEDIPGSASSMKMDPLGRPAFEGSAVADVKKRLKNLVYTYNDGVEWRSEVVATGDEWGSDFSRGFAFDAEGNPAIAWCAQNDSGGVYLARRSPSGEWGTEQVSGEACNRSVGLAFDDFGSPAVAYRVDPEPEFGSVRMARWSGGSWTVETICEAPGCGGVEIYVRGLLYLPQVSDFSIAGDDWWNKWVGCDRLGTTWQCTGPDVVGEMGKQQVIDRPGQFVRSGASVLEVDPSGEIFGSIDGKNGVTPSLQRRDWGSSQWTTEYVDHPSTKGFPAAFELALGSDVGGPFVALDPFGAPTLTWNWVYTQEPTMHGLYFARKGTP